MNNDTQPLSAQLSAWRARLALTREQAAIRLGVSKETYVRWEKGRKAPTSLAGLAAVKRELEAK